MNPIITLPAAKVTQCDGIAFARCHDAFAKRRPPKNGAPVSFDAALQLDRLGMYHECAFYLWAAPIKWNAYLPGGIHGIAEFDTFIDVKGVQKPWHKLIIQKNSNPTWAYVKSVATAPALHRYELAGWAWGHEAMQDRYWSDPVGGRPAFFYNGPLHDMEELRLLIRR